MDAAASAAAQHNNHHHCRSTPSYTRHSPPALGLSVVVHWPPHTHTHKQTDSLLLSLPLSCSQLLLSFVLCLQVLSFLPFLSLLLTTAALREHRCDVPQVSAASVLVSLSNALPLRCQHSQTLRAEHRSEKKKEKEKAQRMRSSMATLN